MLAYFALSIIEALAISHLKRVHDQEIEALEEKAKAHELENSEGELKLSPMSRSTIELESKRERDFGRGYLSD